MIEALAQGVHAWVEAVRALGGVGVALCHLFLARVADVRAGVSAGGHRGVPLWTAVGRLAGLPGRRGVGSFGFCHRAHRGTTLDAQAFVGAFSAGRC